MNARSLVSALAAASLFWTGCSFLSPKKDPTRFYELNATTNRPAAGLKSTGPTIVVNLETAAYLENPSLVRRIAPNQLEYFPFDQWANPFALGLSQTLRADLSRATGRPVVSAGDSYIIRDVLQLRVQMLRFDILPESQVVVAARWEVLNGTNSTQFQQGEFRRQNAYTPSPTSLQPAVAAFSDLLEELSHTIAAGLP